MGVGSGQMAYSYLWGPESRQVETEFNCWYIQGPTHHDLFWVARAHVPKATEIAFLNYATSWGPRFEIHEPVGGIVYLKLNSIQVYTQSLAMYWKGLETVIS